MKNNLIKGRIVVSGKVYTYRKRFAKNIEGRNILDVLENGLYIGGMSINMPYNLRKEARELILRLNSCTCKECSKRRRNFAKLLEAEKKRVNDEYGRLALGKSVDRKIIGKYEFVRSGKAILIFVGDALSDASEEYLTQEECDEAWKKVLKAKKIK